MIDDTYLYVGSLADYVGLWHVDFPFNALDDITDQRVFKIPFSEIL